MSEKVVWIIEYCDEDTNAIVGVFSTLEKAKAAIKISLMERIKEIKEEIKIGEEVSDMDNPYMGILKRDIKEIEDTLSRLDNPLCYTEGSYFVIHSYNLVRFTVDKIY